MFEPGKTSRRVLVVDDDVDFGDSLVDLIGSRDFAARAAYGGDEAMAAIAAFDPGVALVDVRLGRDSGFDLIARIKQQAPDLVCVSMSALTDIETAIDAMRIGADDFMCKPLDPAALFGCLDRSFTKIDPIQARQQAEAAQRRSEDRFRGLFQTSPVSLWVEDWSAIKRMVDGLRRSGVADLRAHFHGHPEFLAAAAAKIELIDVNDATVEVWRARDRDDFLRRMRARLAEEPVDGFGDRLAALADGEMPVVVHATDRRFDGDSIDLEMSLTIPEANRDDWSRVISAINEITQRKQAERDLRDSERWLAEAQRIARLGNWVWDAAEKREIFVSEEAARIFGARGLLDDDAFFEFVHPNDRKRVRREYDESRETKTGRNIHYRIVRPDGEVRHVLELAEAEVDRQGKLIRTIGTVQDITERKLAQSALERGREFLKAVLDNVADGIVACDADGKISLFNQATRAFHGLPEAPLPPEEWAEHYDLYMADGETPMDVSDIPLFRALAGEKISDVEMVIAPKEYPPRLVVASGQPMYGADGGLLGAVVSLRDVTEQRAAADALRRSESRYRMLYNKTPVMLHSIDSAGRLLRASDFWLQHMGYARDEVIGRPIGDFMTPASRQLADKVGIPTFKRDGVVSDLEYQFVRKDGGVIDVQLSSVAEYDEVADDAYSLGVVIDITARKRTEDRLRQSQKMEAVGRLTGGIAHDFNNLLTVILGNLQLLERTAAGDEKLARRIEPVTRAAHRGAELTRRLLSFSRQQVMEKKVIDVNRLVAGMDDMLRRTMGDQTQVKTKLGADVWNCRADPSQLENAILNLAINARDAMPDGGRLIIETNNVEIGDSCAMKHLGIASGNYVVVAVSDSGCGIPDDILPKVFEPFFTTKDPDKGTGLGLSMVYGFAKQSGGNATVYSEVDEGTTIKLYLPRAATDETRVGEEPAVAAPDLNGSETILLVEDNPDVRQVGVAILEDLGYHVLEAEHGHEALAVLRRHPEVDGLFTDIMMPGGMNGLELAEKAGAVKPGLKVLFASGYAMEAFKERGDSYDPENFVGKPYQRAELARKLRQVLEHADDA